MFCISVWIISKSEPKDETIKNVDHSDFVQKITNNDKKIPKATTQKWLKDLKISSIPWSEEVYRLLPGRTQSSHNDALKIASTDYVYASTRRVSLLCVQPVMCCHSYIIMGCFYCLDFIIYFVVVVAVVDYFSCSCSNWNHNSVLCIPFLKKKVFSLWLSVLLSPRFFFLLRSVGFDESIVVFAT